MHGAPVVRGAVVKSVGAFEGAPVSTIGSGGKSVIGAGPESTTEDPASRIPPLPATERPPVPPPADASIDGRAVPPVPPAPVEALPPIPAHPASDTASGRMTDENARAAMSMTDVLVDRPATRVIAPASAIPAARGAGCNRRSWCG